MVQLNSNQTVDYENVKSSWKGLYKLGGAAALIALAGTLLDISITFIPGWGAAVDTKTAIDWFAQFQGNLLLGLRNLDLLNIIISIISIPMFCALYAAHLRVQKSYGLLALVLFIAGTIIFIANNAALPMLALSSKYAAASDAQKVLLAAAGEAILVKGEHGGPGAFLGFMLSTSANLTMAYVMLKGRIFSRTTAYIGLIGFSLLLIYTIAVTFVSKSSNVIMILAMPGGLLAMAWNIMVAKKLLHLSKKSSI
ncbi:MAG: conserved rane protein of unknown function [Clostridia bacterium]|jgi:hypothetical protein|nr:conserved rane protein of unknown function [Clostridia bacterium]